MCFFQFEKHPKCLDELFPLYLNTYKLTLADAAYIRVFIFY